MIYHLKSPTKDIDFNDFIDAEILFNDKAKKLRFKNVEKKQMGFQLHELKSITKIYKSKEEVIKFYNYFKMIHKAAYD